MMAMAMERQVEMATTAVAMEMVMLLVMEMAMVAATMGGGNVGLVGGAPFPAAPPPRSTAHRPANTANHGRGPWKEADRPAVGIGRLGCGAAIVTPPHCRMHCV